VSATFCRLGMNSDYLYNLCRGKNWVEVRKYLASDASKKDKKHQVYCCDVTHRRTCLHWACHAPDDIFKSLIDIGGRELVMAVTGTSWGNRTALHFACFGASYNIMKMLIDVGGKDLVMAKSSHGNTALQSLCYYINEHDNQAEKVKLFLKAADTEEILQIKDSSGKTPLQCAIIEKASTEIQDLLRPRQSSSAVLDDNKVTTEPNKGKPRKVSPRKQCTTSPTTPQEDTNTALLDTIRRLNEQLKEANDRAAPIQRDIVILQNTLQAERAKKLLVQKDKEIEKLQQEKEKNDKDSEFFTRHADNLTTVCSELKKKLQEMEDAANAIELAGRKRKRDNKEHAFTSSEIEGAARYELIMEQLQLEKEQHSQLMKEFLETRRELRIANTKLEQNTSVFRDKERASDCEHKIGAEY